MIADSFYISYKERYHHDHITDYFDEFLIPKIIFV